MVPQRHPEDYNTLTSSRKLSFALACRLVKALVAFMFLLGTAVPLLPFLHINEELSCR